MSLPLAQIEGAPAGSALVIVCPYATQEAVDEAVRAVSPEARPPRLATDSDGEAHWLWVATGGDATAWRVERTIDACGAGGHPTVTYAAGSTLELAASDGRWTIAAPTPAG